MQEVASKAPAVYMPAPGAKPPANRFHPGAELGQEVPIKPPRPFALGRLEGTLSGEHKAEFTKNQAELAKLRTKDQAEEQRLARIRQLEEEQERLAAENREALRLAEVERLLPEFLQARTEWEQIESQMIDLVANAFRLHQAAFDAYRAASRLGGQLETLGERQTVRLMPGTPHDWLQKQMPRLIKVSREVQRDAR